MAEDITTTLRFVGESVSAEESIDRLTAKLQRLAEQTEATAARGIRLQSAQADSSARVARSSDDSAKAREREADAILRQEQAQARLLQVQGQTEQAIKTLQKALEGFTGSQIQAIRAQTQLTYLQTDYANSPLIGAVREQTAALGQYGITTAQVEKILKRTAEVSDTVGESLSDSTTAILSQAGAVAELQKQQGDAAGAAQTLQQALQQVQTAQEAAFDERTSARGKFTEGLRAVTAVVNALTAGLTFYTSIVTGVGTAQDEATVAGAAAAKAFRLAAEGAKAVGEAAVGATSKLRDMVAVSEQAANVKPAETAQASAQAAAAEFLKKVQTTNEKIVSESLAQEQARAAERVAQSVDDLAGSYRRLTQEKKSAASKTKEEVRDTDELAAVFRRLRDQQRRKGFSDTERGQGLIFQDIALQVNRAYETIRDKFGAPLAQRIRDTFDEFKRTGGAVDAVRDRFRALGRDSESTLAQMRQSGLGLGTIFAGLAASLGLVAASVAAVGAASLAAVPLLVQIGRTGIQAASQLEQTRLGIASVIASVGELNKNDIKLTGIDALNAALPIAQEQLDKLRIDALQTALTFDQIAPAFLQAIGPGLAAGLNLDQVRKTVVDLSQLIIPLTGNASQLGQELRAIFSGEVTADAQVAKTLQLRREDIVAAKEQGRLAELLAEKLRVAASAGALMGQTFEAAASNLREAGTLLATQVTRGLFDSLRENINRILPQIFAVAGGKINLAPEFQGLANALTGAFDRAGDLVGAALEGIIDGVKRLSLFLAENERAVSQIVGAIETVARVALAAAGGVISFFAQSAAQLAIFGTQIAPIVVGLTTLIGLMATFGPGATVMAAATARLSFVFNALTASLAATRTALVATSTFLVTTPAGWAILAASVGAAALAYGAFNDRQQEVIEQADRLQLANLQGQFARVAELRKQIAEVDAFTGSQSNLNREQERFGAILSTLPARQREVIDALQEQTDKTEKLRSILQATVSEQEAQAKAQQVLLVQAIAARQSEIEKAEKQIETLAKELRAREELLKVGTRQVTELVGAGGEVVAVTRDIVAEESRLAQQRIESRGSLDDLNKKQAENVAKLRELLPLLGVTEQQLLDQQRAGRLTAEQFDLLTKAMRSTAQAAPGVADGAQLVTGELDKLTLRANEARSAMDALFQTGDAAKLKQQVTARLNELAGAAVKSGQGIKGATDALNAALQNAADPLSQQIKTLKEFEAVDRALQDRINPRQRTGGTRRAAQTETQRTARGEIDQLELKEKEAALAEKRISENLKAALQERFIALEAYTAQSIESERRLLAARLAILDEEARVAARTVTNKAQQEAKLADVRLRQAQAQQETDLRIQQLRDEQRRAEEQAEIEHQQRLQEIRDAFRRAEESGVRDAVSRGDLGRIEGERQLIALERERFAEREALLSEEIVRARESLAERLKLQDQLRLLAVERAAFEVEASRRVREAQSTEAGDFREFVAERVTALLRLRRAEIEARAAETALDVQRGAVNARRAQLADFDRRKELIRLESLERQREIERQAEDLRRQAEQARAGAATFLQIEQEKNANIAAEKRRAAAELQGLEEQRLALEQSLAGGFTGLFSERLNLLIGQFGLFRGVLAGLSEEIEASIRPLDDIFKQAFSSFADGLGQIVQNYVLLGKTGPAVIRRLLAEQLAAISKEAAVNAIKSLALGFMNLFTNPAAAGGYFTAAALWAGIAGGTALVGRAIAPSTSSGSGGVSGEGRNDNGTRFIEQGGALRQEPQVILIRAQYQPGIIIDRVVEDFNANGRTRETLRRDLLRE